MDATPERLIEVATRLFAGLGYDMTSLETISEAAGVPSSVVLEEVGDKRRLYLLVLERIYEANRVKVQKIIDEVHSPHEAAHLIADSYLDFFLERPELIALWTQRWVADAADVPDVEDHYLRPLMTMAARKIHDAVPEALGPYPFLGIVLWSINGFLCTGVLAPEKGMLPAEDPHAQKAFRGFLHTAIDSMLHRPAA
ncbi:TetR/AcrR family transcriptional regulator [Actinocorallia sp. B10E7]|uniref:TetR/AcrR family transcriptional regulator n=1 Tax=Actinocorallia sp. B10E7 TaxID=3153558 RepID=UPI00325C3E27